MDFRLFKAALCASYQHVACLSSSANMEDTEGLCCCCCCCYCCCCCCYCCCCCCYCCCCCCCCTNSLGYALPVCCCCCCSKETMYIRLPGCCCCWWGYPGCCRKEETVSACFGVVAAACAAGDIEEMGERLAMEVISYVRDSFGEKGVDKVSFVGHSLGGIIGTRILDPPPCCCCCCCCFCC